VAVSADHLSRIAIGWHDLVNAVTVDCLFSPCGESHPVEFVSNNDEAVPIPCARTAIGAKLGLDPLVHLRSGSGRPSHIASPYRPGYRVVDGALGPTLLDKVRQGGFLLAWPMQPVDD
jgi:hypothetical protein